MLVNGIEYEINRATAKVQEWDKTYCSLLKDIKEHGELFENRTGIDTLSIEGTYFKLNIGSAFPILESKKVLVKNALSEMLWIYKAQSNDVNWLRKRGNNIWNEWAIDEDGIWRVYDPKATYDPEKTVSLKDLDGRVLTDKFGMPLQVESLQVGKTIKDAKFFGPENADTIGTAYGWILAEFKRLHYILNQLKVNPHDRRLIISLWQDQFLRTAVLPSCVWSTEWKVTDNRLNCFVHQRSADTPLGLPFNVSQYAILLAMVAKASNLEVGNLNWSIMDTHIYVNQIDGINTQLNRYNKMLVIENFVRNCSNVQIEQYYNEKKAEEIKCQDCINRNPSRKTTIEELKILKEEITMMELMITKGKPELELADKNDFFAFSDEVNNDPEYLKENPTGNSDIKIKNYKSAPFIKMPIAQ